MSDQCLRLPFGAPPLRPLARAAAIFAADFDAPPLRPSSTAAGFLGGTTRDGRGQLREALRDFVHGGPVAVFHGEVAGGHQLQAASACGIHRPKIPKRLGYVKC